MHLKKSRSRHVPLRCEGSAGLAINGHPLDSFVASECLTFLRTGPTGAVGVNGGHLISAP